MAGRCEQRLGGLVAMGSFSLEVWETGLDFFSGVAVVVAEGEAGFLQLRSSIANRLFWAKFLNEAPLVGSEVTLLSFALTWDGTSFTAVQMDDSFWFTRAQSCLDGVYKIRELCAGIGALGFGATSVGFQIISANEVQTATCEAYTRNCQAPVVQGDLTDPRVVGKMWLRAPGPAGLCCGFSCQPFSDFGDRRAQADTRSGTLPGTLKAAHWLQAPFVLLECVCPAGQNAWVQSLLDAFCRETGYARSEVQLDTAQVWPCCRKRWWCLLTHPGIGLIRVQPWPEDGQFSSVAQLIDNFQVSQDDLRQLQLTEFELEHFQAHKPLASFCLQVSGKLPTALHSWGSQVYSCPCGCRGPFSEARLAKGISAVLVPFVDSEQGIAFRHLHPRELALLNGYPPSASFGGSLRLSLALLGQLASPLQSAWVLRQLWAVLGGRPDGERAAIAHLTQQRCQLLGQAKDMGMLSEAKASQAVASLQLSLAAQQVQVSPQVPNPNPCCLLGPNLSPTPCQSQHFHARTEASEHKPEPGQEVLHCSTHGESCRIAPAGVSSGCQTRLAAAGAVGSVALASPLSSWSATCSDPCALPKVSPPRTPGPDTLQQDQGTDNGHGSRDQGTTTACPVACTHANWPAP